MIFLNVFFMGWSPFLFTTLWSASAFPVTEIREVLSFFVSSPGAFRSLSLQPQFTFSRLHRWLHDIRNKIFSVFFLLLSVRNCIAVYHPGFPFILSEWTSSDHWKSLHCKRLSRQYHVFTVRSSRCSFDFRHYPCHRPSQTLKPLMFQVLHRPKSVISAKSGYIVTILFLESRVHFSYISRYFVPTTASLQGTSASFGRFAVIWYSMNHCLSYLRFLPRLFRMKSCFCAATQENSQFALYSTTWTRYNFIRSAKLTQLTMKHSCKRMIRYFSVVIKSQPWIFCDYGIQSIVK